MKTIFYVNKLKMPKWYSVLMALATVFDAAVTILTLGHIGSCLYMNMFTSGITRYIRKK